MRPQIASRPVSPIGKTVLANNVNMKISSERSFASGSNVKVKPVPIAYIPAETLLTGKGYMINIPKPEDKTAIVGFVTPPKGHVEAAEDEAAEFGYLKLYKGPGLSVFTIGFEPDTHKMTMDNYVRERQGKFNDKYPEGKFSTVNFDPIVTQHLTKKQDVTVSAQLFDPKGGPYSNPVAKISFYIKTPGGFWDIAWHTQLSNIHDPKQNMAFIEAIKQLNIVWKENVEEVKKEKSAADRTTVHKRTASR
jgi:hypothetical protein